MSRPRLIALLLAFATLLVYLPVGRFGFTNLDDNDYVTENNFVTHGLTVTDIHWAFTAFHSGNWHPLTWLSLMLDCQLFGLNGGAFHFVNVLWHALNVALLFTWLVRLTNRLWPAAFIAALFAWHPLHVESVAWIAERKDVLSTFFALLTLLAYTKYVQEKNRRSLWLALIFFALGLMAKPMLVTLPFVLLLLDFWPLKRLVPFQATVLWEKIPFFVLTGIVCVITFFAQQEAIAPLTRVSLGYRLENAPVAMAGYLAKLFVPENLCVLYPLPPHLEIASVLLSVMLLAGISIVAWQWRRSRPYFLMGWLWYLGTLIPVIGLVQVGVQAMADRYTYLPSIGFFIAGVFLLAELAEKKRIPAAVAASFAAVISAACILGTEHQLPFWRDTETLFRHAIAVTQDNDVAHLNLGAELGKEGRLDEATGELREALRINPSLYEIHNDLGNLLSADHQPTEAAAEFRIAIQLKPELPYQHNSLGIVLVQLGQEAAARQEFSEAERLDPQYPWPHVETAKLFLAAGRDSEAVTELRTALQLQPDNPDILAYTAHVLAADKNAGARDGQTALALALKANALQGNQPVILDAMGMAFAETGDYTNAAACASNALNLAADTGMAETNTIRQRLELYQSHQPWRESFGVTNAAMKAP